MAKARQQKATATAGTRQPLTRERIFDVAGTLVDEEGVDALSMRRLSQELGVASTAVYWHVRTREELLRGVLERAINRVEVPVVDEVEWDEGLRILCRSLASVLEHPHIVDLAHRVRSDATYLLFHRTVQILLKVGFSARYSVESALLLQSYVYGFGTARSRSAAIRPHDAEMPQEALAAWFRAAGSEGAALLEPYLNIDHDQLFERGLADHIDGIRRALNEPGPNVLAKRAGKGRAATP